MDEHGERSNGLDGYYNQEPRLIETSGRIKCPMESGVLPCKILVATVLRSCAMKTCQAAA